MPKRLRVKYPLFLSDFDETGILSAYFRKSLKFQSSSKSVKREPSCFMLTDRRTDMMKPVVAFCNLANASKKSITVGIYAENWMEVAEEPT